MFHECFLKDSANLTTPSAPSAVASQHFISGASTPPFQGGESVVAKLPLPISGFVQFQNLFPAAVAHLSNR